METSTPISAWLTSATKPSSSAAPVSVSESSSFSSSCSWFSFVSAVLRLQPYLFSRTLQGLNGVRCAPHVRCPPAGTVKPLGLPCHHSTYLGAPWGLVLGRGCGAWRRRLSSGLNFTSHAVHRFCQVLPGPFPADGFWQPLSHRLCWPGGHCWGWQCGLIKCLQSLETRSAEHRHQWGLLDCWHLVPTVHGSWPPHTLQNVVRLHCPGSFCGNLLPAALAFPGLPPGVTICNTTKFYSEILELFK